MDILKLFTDLSGKKWYEQLTAFVVIVILFVVVRAAFSDNSLVEGLTNDDSNSASTRPTPDVMVDPLKKRNEELRHHLRLDTDDDKYHTHYEDIIIHQEEWCNLEILKAISDEKHSSNNSKKHMALVKRVNKLREYKKSLEESMKFIDSQ